MDSRTPISYGTNDQSPIDSVGYALDYPLNGDLTRLTYEELHTLNVLVSKTIDIFSGNPNSNDEVIQLEKFIFQYQKEGRVIYYLIHEHLPHLENPHNVVIKLTKLIKNFDTNNSEALAYFNSINDGLSKVLDQEFQYITIDPKVKA